MFFAVNDDLEFKIKIDSVVSGPAFKSSEWESGYKYIFAELNVPSLKKPNLMKELTKKS